MGQSYKVFIKDKVIVFRENINNSNIRKKDLIHIYKNQKKLISEFQSFIKNKRHKNLYVVRKKNVDKLFIKFISNYHIIKASGGLVINNLNQILMIYRHGRWDIPKGKKKTNKESNKKAALREVTEETSLSKLQIEKKLPITYHFFRDKQILFIKKTHWYLMKNTINQIPEPANGEGITKVAWYGKNEISKINKATYRSVKEVIDSAKKYMKK